MEIAPGVHHFTRYKFNWYVVVDDDGLTVIDAGFPGHYRLLVEGLAGLGRTVRDVESVIVTHAHADHIGFARRLAAESGAPVYVHQDDAALVGRPLYLPWPGLLSHAWRPYTASMLAHAVAHGLLRLPRIPAPRPVGDGDVIDAPGRPRVIHLPGHTPGDIVVHLPERGLLFTGDALVTRDLYTGRDGDPQLTAPSLNFDYPQATRSLSRLEHLGEITLLPGHGRPWTGTASGAVAAARAGHAAQPRATP